MPHEHLSSHIPDFLPQQSLEWAQSFAKDLETARKIQYPPNMQVLFAFGCKDQRKNEERLKMTAEILIKTALTKRAKTQSFAFRNNSAPSQELNDYLPLFVFNGTKTENNQLKTFMKTPYWQIPQDKVLIFDEFCPKDITTPKEHENTKDQIESFYSHISDVASPLFGVNEIGILSHAAHFVRIPFYLEEVNKKYQTRLDYKPFYWIFRVRENENFRAELEKELAKLKTSAQQKALAPNPYQDMLIA